MAITDYKVVSERNADNLSSTVAGLVADGWQPQGAVVYNPVADAYLQTLVMGAVSPNGGSGVTRLVDLTDIQFGALTELAVGDIVMCAGGNPQDGFFWINTSFATTMVQNIDARFDQLRMAYVDPASPTALIDLLGAMVAKGWMASAAKPEGGG
ncbi:MAG: hypothetical protein ACREP7_15010 [Lysobacter sp.]